MTLLSGSVLAIISFSALTHAGHRDAWKKSTTFFPSARAAFTTDSEYAVYSPGDFIIISSFTIESLIFGVFAW